MRISSKPTPRSIQEIPEAVLVLLGRRRGFWAAASVIFICPIVRILLWHFYSLQGIGFRFETVADAIASGCLLAGAREWLHGQTVYRKILESKLFVTVPIVVFSVHMLYTHPMIYFAISHTMMNLGIALCLDYCITYHSGIVGRILNARPLVFWGVISYSTYLWQQVFLNRYSASVMTGFPINISLVVVAALASYYIIEQPCLRLRQRLEQRLFVYRDKPAAMTPATGALTTSG